MTTVDEIKSAIDSLPEDKFAQLRKWFSEKDWERWDNEIEKDAESGKLDFLVKEAKRDKKEGKLEEL